MNWQDTREWILVVHIWGFVMWMGAMMGCIHMLSAHNKADDNGRKIFGELEKGLGIAMDIGATLAMAAGLYLALGGPHNLFKGGGWLHAKVALVFLGMGGLHGFLRRKIRVFRKGDVKPIPGILFPALVVMGLTAIILVMKRPF